MNQFICFQNQIHKITPATVVTNYAGNGNAASEDGSPGSFWNPTGLKFDNAGLLYVADFNNCKIRTIDASKKVSTVAGFSGDFHSISPGSVNGAIGSASFRTPNDVAIDVKGNIYVADTGNHLIRMINADRTTVSSLAGNGTAGSINGLGNAASFNYPNSLVVDASGNIYVADTGNNLIRKIVIY